MVSPELADAWTRAAGVVAEMARERSRRFELFLAAMRAPVEGVDPEVRRGRIERAEYEYRTAQMNEAVANSVYFEHAETARITALKAARSPEPVTSAIADSLVRLGRAS